MKRVIKNKGNLQLALNNLKNDKNNAVAFVYDKIENKNVGLFKDVVVTIKDNYATNDAPTSASSLILEKFNTHYNATVIDKFIQQGALIPAKLHLDELALGGTGTHSAYGIVKNKFDSSRLSGGSSSGSIATFDENISIALASDTGDSVRLPASYNGAVGFKPSYGAISRYGLFAYASSLDTVAYFTHNVNDAIVTSQILFGKDKYDMTSLDIEIKEVIKTKPKKIALLNFSKFSEDYVNVSVEKLHKNLKKEGVDVDVIEPNLDILNAIKPVYKVISFSEASSNLANLNGIAFGSRVEGDSWEEVIKNTRSSKFGKMVQERLSLGSYFLYSENIEEIFVKAQKARRVIKDYMNDLHEKYDAVIFQAFGGVAPNFDQNSKYGVLEFILTAANLGGYPSITIPFDKHKNLPYNLTIESKIYSDAKLLGIAEYFEELLGGK
ncbi:Asp-tRNA(Asn)/Glu-tRNA(Gln) amidotransferase subunit GatA [Mycoplasma sp. CSL10137]|uniref:amidase family protein n=1 Tax=unclassified Mycoplasma TaxID=2683645 RepID=UPI00197BAF21|nr:MULTISPECIES: amidase family protein [unclassified Mycoplasma]MBN4083237.1 Asp-tRNA(Asn)/Glu-tRNA(Gln) amidotransferase subunit GatA [Mycoplasma sp. CSL10137]MBU4692946.1 Asp-tRNA(Asn)/Glu-tRNA(Gln) amidotransferase subunit GatA [Mycoplasma sp. CSL7491-lung]